MAKLTKTSVFKAQVPKRETSMDKTTRIVREIVDEEAEQRQAKTAKLRKSRLDWETSTPNETVKVAPRKRSSKAV